MGVTLKQMADTSKIAMLLERFAQGVAAHDRENPDHNSWGIGMAHFDIERLGLEEGEEILPGIVLQADGGGTGASASCATASTRSRRDRRGGGVVDAVASEEIAEPVYGPGGAPPPPLRPPL